MKALCGAKTRSGTPCKRAPVAGKTRCKLHGGAATGRPCVSGRYSVTHRASLAAKMDAFRADERPGDLQDELSLMRALMQDYLSRFADGVPLRADDVGRLFDMLDTISKLVERIARIQSQTALTVSEVAFLQARIASMIGAYVEPAKQEQFLLELSDSLSEVNL
jgi:hypothetical protein